MTFQDLQRSAAEGTGPELELLNVTAWCGPNWETAESTAAAALAQSSSEPSTVYPPAADIGRRGSPGSDSGSPAQQISSLSEADGVSTTEDGTNTSSKKRTGWIRPLAVAGGCCACLHLDEQQNLFMCCKLPWAASCHVPLLQSWMHGAFAKRVCVVQLECGYSQRSSSCVLSTVTSGDGRTRRQGVGIMLAALAVVTCTPAQRYQHQHLAQI